MRTRNWCSSPAARSGPKGPTHTRASRWPPKRCHSGRPTMPRTRRNRRPETACTRPQKCTTYRFHDDVSPGFLVVHPSLEQDFDCLLDGACLPQNILHCGARCLRKHFRQLSDHCRNLRPVGSARHLKRGYLIVAERLEEEVSPPTREEVVLRGDRLNDELQRRIDLDAGLVLDAASQGVVEIQRERLPADGAT